MLIARVILHAYLVASIAIGTHVDVDHSAQRIFLAGHRVRAVHSRVLFVVLGFFCPCRLKGHEGPGPEHNVLDGVSRCHLTCLFSEVREFVFYGKEIVFSAFVLNRSLLGRF